MTVISKTFQIFACRPSLDCRCCSLLRRSQEYDSRLTRRRSYSRFPRPPRPSSSSCWMKGSLFAFTGASGLNHHLQKCVELARRDVAASIVEINLVREDEVHRG